MVSRNSAYFQFDKSKLCFLDNFEAGLEAAEAEAEVAVSKLDGGFATTGKTKSSTPALDSLANLRASS